MSFYSTDQQVLMQLGFGHFEESYGYKGISEDSWKIWNEMIKKFGSKMFSFRSYSGCIEDPSSGVGYTFISSLLDLVERLNKEIKEDRSKIVILDDILDWYSDVQFFSIERSKTIIMKAIATLSDKYPNNNIPVWYMPCSKLSPKSVKDNKKYTQFIRENSFGKDLWGHLLFYSALYDLEQRGEVQVKNIDIQSIGSDLFVFKATVRALLVRPDGVPFDRTVLGEWRLREINNKAIISYDGKLVREISRLNSARYKWLRALWESHPQKILWKTLLKIQTPDNIIRAMKSKISDQQEQDGIIGNFKGLSKEIRKCAKELKLGSTIKVQGRREFGLVNEEFDK